MNKLLTPLLLLPLAVLAQPTTIEVEWDLYLMTGSQETRTVQVIPLNNPIKDGDDIVYLQPTYTFTATNGAATNDWAPNDYTVIISGIGATMTMQVPTSGGPYSAAGLMTDLTTYTYTVQTAGTPCEIGLACSAVDSLPSATGVAITFRAPYAMTLTEVYASVAAVPTGLDYWFDVEINDVDVVTGTGDGNEIELTVATDLYVSQTSLDVTSIAKDDKIEVDISQLPTGGGENLIVWLKGTRN